jgi:hypothetical protein
MVGLFRLRYVLLLIRILCFHQSKVTEIRIGKFRDIMQFIKAIFFEWLNIMLRLSVYGNLHT